MTAGSSTWVGELPKDWRCDWLKWNVQLSTERPTEEEQERLPYIANEDIESWTGKLLKDDPQPADSDGRKFAMGDVLFNKLRPYLAKVHHAQFDGVSSGELLCLRPSGDVLPKYLFYVLASKGFIDTVDAETFGSKMPRADWDIVGHQLLPLPSLETQQCIVRFLDEKTARIDALIAKKCTLLERLAEKRQALITRAVTKGLNQDVPMKPSGIDWLGEVPAHWNLLSLRRMAKKVGTGKTPPSTGADYFSNGEMDWYTPGDFGFRIELGDSAKKLVPDAIGDGVANEFPAFCVLLVSIGATLGKVAVAPKACSANQQINAISLQPGNDPYYLAYFLHAFQNEVRMISNGNTLGILNQDGTKSLKVLHPFSYAEQSKISNLLREFDKDYARVIGKINESIDAMIELRSAIVTDAVTGQIAELN